MTPRQRLAGLVGAGVIALAWPAVQLSEGRSLDVYLDPVSIPTVCDGVTGSGVQVGQPRRTPEQCDDMLAAELQRHDVAMMACVHVPLSDGQHAAFLSFTYNVGPARFCSSTLAKKLNARDYAGACAELLKWVYAGGKPLSGLVKRRERERAICEGRPLTAPATS